MTRKTATPPDPKKPAPKKRASGTAAPKAKIGRPSSYRAEYAQQAVKLCRLGLLAPPSVRHAVCDVRYRVERDERTPDLFARIAA